MKHPSGGHALTAHPDTPPRAVAGVFVTYVWRDANAWSFDFTVKAPRAALALPTQVAPSRGDRLWERTCFEVFLLNPEDGSYLEFNFSPSGQWAAYGFDAYRSGMRNLDLLAPPLVHTADSDSSDRYALFARCDDSGLHNARPWRGGLTAIIEEADGTRSFWALAHPPGQPDFHRAEGFVLDLPAMKANR